ncbi:hypothetical protein DMH04_36330 [Kibdelosporangium aridum]|uniref:Uncharacterized protein n=1 Tax=Kibdelosporangium aridum TaxID=2030 RepID=A0A428YZF8_KIBAR|nr:hypothetical protein [Kibdelosporangium aridum]RSM76781.1 hypothetical protein DMH04_36330 [Kibdelosporangium aridum]
MAEEQLADAFNNIPNRRQRRRSHHIRRLVAANELPDCSLQNVIEGCKAIKTTSERYDFYR